jgi:putative tryptophan/tyrosine transport system substrate-binding protein
MRRRKFIGLIGSVAAVPLLWVQVARAQEPGRIYRLGMITAAARQAPRIVAFFDELKGLGFVEGQNLKIVAGGFNLRDDQLAEVAATLAKSAPDVIFCISPSAVRAIRETIHTVPIVGTSADMVASGFVGSLARPGGNITGVSFLSPELNSKRQEILMEAVPGARRIAVLAELNNTQPAELQALQNAARAHNLDVAVFTVGAPEQIAPAMDQAKAWGGGGT